MKKVAIIYDFDHTLIKGDMQEGGFINSFDLSVSEYWKNVDKLMINSNMDSILAAMYYPVLKAKELDLQYDKAFLEKYGREISTFYPGVGEWFDEINSYGKNLGLDIEHYVISSGFKEMIDNCKIAKHFKGVFACSYHYGKDGGVLWPSYVVNYTQKTQYLSRIQKGCFDVLYESVEINRLVEENDQYIPFDRMIYIGDGVTDVPCMRIVKQNGGLSVCVYDLKGKSKADSLLKDGRVSVAVEADYRLGSSLDNSIKEFLEKI
ncbi:MAG: haloacid dehalogenase-like hydrolase [Clostridia bacterium]|nr:haloacid dehalogenase-like hydrolase [Clostridia bacterium]